MIWPAGFRAAEPWGLNSAASDRPVLGPLGRSRPAAIRAMAQFTALLLVLLLALLLVLLLVLLLDLLMFES